VEPPSVPGGAVALLADAAASHEGLVIVALGPLTNLAAAVEAHPELVERVAMTYSMGGAFAVDGNTPDGAAEWNYAVDPAAVDVVVGSGLPLTIVPLDATAAVPANRAFDRRLAASTSPAAATVHDLWSAAMPWQHGFELWDELTAVVAVDPTIAGVGEQRIEVITDGPDAGRTVIRPDGAPVRIVTAPDRRTVEERLIAGLTGST
jgi:inosine-uridine nucleoside N-ribohydrolase